MQNKIQIWEWLVFWWAGRIRESDFLDFDAEAGVSQSTLVCDRNDETACIWGKSMTKYFQMHKCHLTETLQFLQMH